jgi:hypothetical protein
MRLPEPDEDLLAFHRHMTSLLRGLPTAVMVHSARELEGAPVLFDDVK